MREKLELLREMGVQMAAFTSTGELIEVAFFPPEQAFELPTSERPTLDPPPPVGPAVLHAVNRLRGVRDDS